MPELKWRAVYRDGTYLHQEGSGHEPAGRYADIDRKRLVQFELCDPADGGRAVARVILQPGRRLVARRRTCITVTPEGQQARHFWLLGWQELGWADSQGTRNRQAIMTVWEDERQPVTLSGARGDDDIVLLDCEARDVTGPE